MDEFRTPVQQLPVQLLLEDGRCEDATVYLPTGQAVPDLLSAVEPFVPMRIGGRVHLLARSAVAAVVVPKLEDPDNDAWLPPDTQEDVAVRLRCGARFEGQVRFSAPASRRRTIDFLNDGAASFRLYTGTDVIHIVKRHVVDLEELV